MNSRIVIIACFLLILGISAQAQWVQTNGPDSVNVNAVVASGTNLFAATNGGGVFLSTDNGDNWSAVNTGLTEGDVMSLALNGTNLFAGDFGYGVFLSTDSGAHWRVMNTGLLCTMVLSLGVSGSTLFAGTEDLSSGQVPIDGFRSTDSGTHWTEAWNGLTSPRVMAFASEGGNIFAGTGNGVFLSTDNGISWSAVNNGLTALYTMSLAVSGTNIFAGTYEGGIFRTTDSGANWSAVNTGLTKNIPWSLRVHSLASSGPNLFAGTEQGVFISTDNGDSWSETSGLAFINIIQSLAVSDAFLFAGTASSGVWRLSLSSLGVTETKESQSEIKINSFPNPFSQSTEITFTSQAAGYAGVSIVNMLGVEVARLYSGELGAGEHSFMWGDPTGLPDGVYECLVRMNGQVETVPAVLMR
jgi:photosystem II stability/assembly factor-like uncharacterized protein